MMRVMSDVNHRFFFSEVLIIIIIIIIIITIMIIIIIIISNIYPESSIHSKVVLSLIHI